MSAWSSTEYYVHFFSNCCQYSCIEKYCYWIQLSSLHLIVCVGQRQKPQGSWKSPFVLIATAAIQSETDSNNADFQTRFCLDWWMVFWAQEVCPRRPFSCRSRSPPLWPSSREWCHFHCAFGCTTVIPTVSIVFEPSKQVDLPRQAKQSTSLRIYLQGSMRHCEADMWLMRNISRYNAKALCKHRFLVCSAWWICCRAFGKLNFIHSCSRLFVMTFRLIRGEMLVSTKSIPLLPKLAQEMESKSWAVSSGACPTALIFSGGFLCTTHLWGRTYSTFWLFWQRSLSCMEG